MNQTPRARRHSGAPVALITLMLAIPAAAQADSLYQVVLKDGTAVAAATRPAIAMGKVSFLNGENRAVTLAAHEVDLDATRAGLGQPVAHSRKWTERSLATVKGKIQIVGESEAPAEAKAEERADTTAQAAPDEAASAYMTDAERLRAEIQALNVKMKPLAPKDRQRTLLMLRQMELQQELSRLLRPTVSS